MAIVELLCAGKSLSEINAWFGHKKTIIYDLAKKCRDSENQDEVPTGLLHFTKQEICGRGFMETSVITGLMTYGSPLALTAIPLTITCGL